MGAEVIAIPVTIGLVFWALYHFTRKRPSPAIERLKIKLAAVDPSFKNLNMVEGDQSETEDKSLITICVKDPITKEEYRSNTLVYVALHEIAHVLNKPQFEEHGPEWKGVFANLLDRAETKGIYNPSIPLETLYCGIDTTKAARIVNPKVHHRRNVGVGRVTRTTRERFNSYQPKRSRQVSS